MTPVPKWRNWQTRQVQDLVAAKAMGVQIPPSAPFYCRVCLSPSFIFSLGSFSTGTDAMAEEKKMKCAECGSEYQVVDKETNVTGKTYLLLECSKCKRCIIVPESAWKKEGS